MKDEVKQRIAYAGARNRDVMNGEMHNMPCPVFISSMVVHMTANKSQF